MTSILAFMVSCQPSEFSRTALTFGTSVYIRLLEGGSEVLLDESFKSLLDIEKMMSVSTDDYETTVLLDINRRSHDALRGLGNAELSGTAQNDMLRYALPTELREVLAAGLEIASLTDGAFDPTIEPLIRIWGFNSGEAIVPTQERIDEALSLVGWSTAAVYDDGTLGLRRGQSLDVGAIAKGYAADIIRDYLISNGVRAAVLDFGGNILVFGTKSNKEPWRIGIQRPYSPNEIIAVLETEGSAVVTSGVYERYFEQDGKRYFHILNAESGYPAENELLSVTIVHANSMEADAYATGVFVMGLEKGFRFVEAQEGMEAIFLTRDREVILSSGLVDSVEVVDDEYRLREFK